MSFATLLEFHLQPSWQAFKDWIRVEMRHRVAATRNRPLSQIPSEDVVVERRNVSKVGGTANVNGMPGHGDHRHFSSATASASFFASLGNQDGNDVKCDVVTESPESMQLAAG